MMRLQDLKVGWKLYALLGLALISIIFVTTILLGNY